MCQINCNRGQAWEAQGQEPGWSMVDSSMCSLIYHVQAICHWKASCNLFSWSCNLFSGRL